MDPRDAFDPNADPDRDVIELPAGTSEPPPDDVRSGGTSEVLAGAGDRSETNLGSAGDTQESLDREE